MADSPATPAARLLDEVKGIRAVRFELIPLCLCCPSVHELFGLHRLDTHSSRVICK